MAYVQSRPADGHTLLGVTNNLVFTPLTRPALKYSSKDFTPLIMWGFDAKVIAVKTDSPYRTIEDLVAAARRRPGNLKIGTFGLGSDDHIIGYLLGDKAQATFGFVPFDGGGEQLAALLGGHIDANISEVSEVRAQLDAQRVPGPGGSHRRTTCRYAGRSHPEGKRLERGAAEIPRYRGQKRNSR